MSDDNKPEWPPLLPPGFWPMTLSELRVTCVDAFPLSTRRPLIMGKLETVIAVLDRNKIPAKIWIDGSFLTRKIEPDDVDIILAYDGDVYDTGTRLNRAVIDLFRNQPFLNRFDCHAFLVAEYPNSTDPVLRGTSEWDRAYWINKFGFSRGNDEHGNRVNGGLYKGMAVIETPFVTNSGDIVK